MTHAIILFGHGSRDPLWRTPIEAVAGRVRARQPGTPVTCAYLELDAPDLPTAAADLVAGGADRITILPMFLGSGRHARDDLPALLQRVKAQHPGVVFVPKKAVGEDDRVLDLLAKIAME